MVLLNNKEVSLIFSFAVQAVALIVSNVLMLTCLITVSSSISPVDPQCK